MELRNLVLTVALVFAAIPTGAQDPGLPTGRQISATQLSVEHQAGLAPWLDVRADKRQYYAYRRYAPPDVLAQLDRPVVGSAVRSLLGQRAAAFQSGDRRMRLTIDPDAIVNLGAEQPDNAASVVLVDLGKSPELWNSLLQELKLDPVNNYVIPTLASRFAQQRGGSTYVAHDTLMVSVAAKNHSRVILYELKEGRWNKLSDLSPSAVPIKEPLALQRRLKPRSETLQYQGLEMIARASAQPAAGQALVSSVSAQQMEHILGKYAVENPSKDAPGTSLSGTSPAPKDSLPQPGGGSLPGVQTPPPSYLAYGRSPWCNRQCSLGSCLGCCAAAHAAEQATIVGSSLACHIASDLCPWCHVGCSIMTGSMFAAMANMDTLCLTTCPLNSRTPATNNPQRCPVQ